eukprot:5836205-Pleurochrysis_carterae.AAC.2
MRSRLGCEKVASLQRAEGQKEEGARAVYRRRSGGQRGRSERGEGWRRRADVRGELGRSEQPAVKEHGRVDRWQDAGVMMRLAHAPLGEHVREL